MKGLSLVVAFVVACSLAPAARADEAQTAGLAQGLFEKARDEMKQGHYAAAYPELVESQRLDPSPGTLLNLVLCEEGLGRIASAWVHARELVDTLSASDVRRAVTERRLGELSKRLARLTVRLPEGAPRGIHVSLDSVDLGESSLGVALPVDPGAHQLVTRAPGRADRSADVAVAEGERADWTADVGPLAKPEVAAPAALPALEAPMAAPPAPLSASIAARAPRWPAWVSLGAGAAGLVAGGVLAALAAERRSTVLADCPAKQCNDARDLEAASQGQAFFVGAVAALGASAASTGIGAYLLWHAGPAGSGHEALGVVASYTAAF